MKLRSLAVALAALTLSSGSVLAQTAAPAPAAAPATDKATLSYALGYDFGEGLAATAGSDIDVNAAIAAFKAVDEKGGMKDIANLWSLYASTR